MNKVITILVTITTSIVLSTAASATEVNFDNTFAHGSAGVREYVDYRTVLNKKHYARKQNAIAYRHKEECKKNQNAQRRYNAVNKEKVRTG